MYRHYRHVGIVVIYRESVFVGLGIVYTLLFTSIFSSRAFVLDIKVFLIPHSVYIFSKQNIIAICMHLRQAIHF